MYRDGKLLTGQEALDGPLGQGKSRNMAEGCYEHRGNACRSRELDNGYQLKRVSTVAVEMTGWRDWNVDAGVSHVPKLGEDGQMDR